MREFFHGWRRKAGLATLVMAYGLMGLWIRSGLLPEELEIHNPFGRSDAKFVSLDNNLEYWRLPWREGIASTRPTEWKRVCCIPYWSVVIPLTLLSVVLVLWKPRKHEVPNA